MTVPDEPGLDAQVSKFLIGYTALVVLWVILELSWRMRRIRAKLS